MFDKTFKEGLPAKKANRILWDFYQQVWKSKVNKGVGFANSKDQTAKSSTYG